MPSFNRDFDDDLGNQLISVYKEQVGCFACRKPAPTQRCGQCQAVWYCNRECQVKDWKAQHKQLCQVWCDNRAEDNGSKGPVPICMRSCGFIGDNSMIQGLEVRRGLFFKEVKRIAEGPGLQMSLVAGVIEMLGHIRLVVGAQFLDGDSLEKINVNHVLVHMVDKSENPDHVKNLYDESGTLPEASKTNVILGLTDLAEMAREHRALITSITFGRGIMYIAEDKGFQKVIEAAAGRNILWIPDMRYAV